MDYTNPCIFREQTGTQLPVAYYKIVSENPQKTIGLQGTPPVSGLNDPESEKELNEVIKQCTDRIILTRLTRFVTIRLY